VARPCLWASSVALDICICGQPNEPDEPDAIDHLPDCPTGSVTVARLVWLESYSPRRFRPCRGDCPRQRGAAATRCAGGVRGGARGAGAFPCGSRGGSAHLGRRGSSATRRTARP
jgi:hypothetical protein